MSEQSSSSKTASKAATRTKGKYSSEAPKADEKKALSETPEEKKMRREVKKEKKEKKKKEKKKKEKKEKEKKEKEKSRHPFESTVLSSADEPEAVSSSILSALKSVDGYDDDDDTKPKATSKVKRAPSIVFEAKEEIESCSRSSKEAASASPSTKARKATNFDSFQRKFDRDEQPSTGARMAAATAPLALQTPMPVHQDTSDKIASLQSSSRVSKSVQSSSSKTMSKPKPTPKQVKRAPVAAEGNEDIEVGSRLSKAAESTIIKARKATSEDLYRRKFDRDERPSADAMVAGSASTSAIDTRRQKLSRDEQRSGALSGVLGSSSHPVPPQSAQSSSPGAVPVEGKATSVDLYRRKFDRDERPSADVMVAGPESTSAIDTRRQKPSRDEQRSGAPSGVLGSSSHPVPPQNVQSSSPGVIPVEGKATNVDIYRRKFDRDERPSAGDAMVAGSASASTATSKARKVTSVDAKRSKFGRDERPSVGDAMAVGSASASASTATSKARKVASVDARRSKFDRDERPSASASTSAIDTRRRKLCRDEQPSGATPCVPGSSLPLVLPQGGQLANPEALGVEGLELITESDEIFELNTIKPSSQRSPEPAQNGDTAGFLAEAFLVTEDPPMITAVADVVPDPPPTKFWRGSKFQCLILCLILVVGVSVGVVVGGSGGASTMSFTLSSSPALVPSTAPSSAPSISTAPSFGFEVLLAQSLPTNSQGAILVEDTPEAQAVAWLQDDPAVSNYTELELLQRFALATLYYATDGDNWRNNKRWLDYDSAECGWFADKFSPGSCTNDGRYRNLVLPRNGLSGELPDALAVLTDLQAMILLDNFLTGQLPSTLESFSELTDLDISGNRLNGTVPSEYGLLLNLEAMYLENNFLTGTIPSTLGSLTQLSTLWLFGNRLTGSVPVELCEPVQRNELDLEIDCDLVDCGDCGHDCGCNSGLDDDFF